MWFLWGFLMFFICHIAMNLFLSFIKEYNETQEGMNLFVAFGAVVFYVGALIFGLNVIGNTAAILVGNGIGFCTGFAHYKTNLRNKELQKRINDMNNDRIIRLKDMREYLESEISSQVSIIRRELVNKLPSDLHNLMMIAIERTFKVFEVTV